MTVKDRIGLQTISWGPIIYRTDVLFEQARELRFHGIEFAQDPATLGEPVTLARQLREADLQAVGLAGGSLPDRVRYASGLALDYLYLDEWNGKAVRDALDAGFRIGLHPHYHKKLGSLADAVQYLNVDPRIGLILDTAHLHLIGDDIYRGVQAYMSRVYAVHLKDYDPSYGRSYPNYVRGFAALGDGILGRQIETTLRYLIDNGFEGWVIIEQDITSGGNPISYAKKSRDWLSDHLGL